MVSAMVDEIRGFGFPIEEGEWATINDLRDKRGRPHLKESPGIHFLEYGKNKDGYWNWDLFSSQLIDFIDCFDALYPQHQLMMEIDWSAGDKIANSKSECVRVCVCMIDVALPLNLTKTSLKYIIIRALEVPRRRSERQGDGRGVGWFATQDARLNHDGRNAR
jgi:hypothetical protein